MGVFFCVESLAYDGEDACMNAKAVAVLAFIFVLATQATALLDLRMPFFAGPAGRIHFGME